VFNTLTNIQEVASADRGKVEEVKRKQRLSGFNSIFAVASVPMAKLYYEEFKKQMKADPTKAIKIAVIYSYGANEEEPDGILDEENPEDTSALDQSSRDFLEAAISDYNQMFHTNYSTDGDKFQNYYKDVSLRMKNKELDMLIVVNMFLTGFDATTLNTLWVDKNLKMHGLIQAFINGINDVDDIINEWLDYVVNMREQELVIIIEQEHLKSDETRRFLDNAFRDGEIKTIGTDIDKLLPPVSRFGSGNRANKKKIVVDRLKAYFEKFYGIGGNTGFVKKEG
jgi:type I site-specific restriction-modification system R (restriction) subunit